METKQLKQIEGQDGLRKDIKTLQEGQDTFQGEIRMIKKEIELVRKDLQDLKSTSAKDNYEARLATLESAVRGLESRISH